MKNKTKIQPIGIRPDSLFPGMRDQLLKIAKEEGRPLSNLIVNIVHAYLSSTNGKFIKKLPPVDERTL